MTALTRLLVGDGFRGRGSHGDVNTGAFAGSACVVSPGDRSGPRASGAPASTTLVARAAGLRALPVLSRKHGRARSPAANTCISTQYLMPVLL